MTAGPIATSPTDETTGKGTVRLVRAGGPHHNLGREAEAAATALRLRAERRLGELLREGRQSGIVAGQGQRNVTLDDVSTLDDLGITRNESSQFPQLADVPQSGDCHS